MSPLSPTLKVPYEGPRRSPVLSDAHWIGLLPSFISLDPGSEGILIWILGPARLPAVAVNVGPAWYQGQRPRLGGLASAQG